MGAGTFPRAASRGYGPRSRPEFPRLETAPPTLTPYRVENFFPQVLGVVEPAGLLRGTAGAAFRADLPLRGREARRSRTAPLGALPGRGPARGLDARPQEAAAHPQGRPLGLPKGCHRRPRQPRGRGSGRSPGAQPPCRGGVGPRRRRLPGRGALDEPGQPPAPGAACAALAAAGRLSRVEAAALRRHCRGRGSRGPPGGGPQAQVTPR